MKTKKFVSVLCCIMIAALVSVGCGNQEKSASTNLNQESGNSKYHIVTTIFPAYDWAKNVIGETPGKADITMLLDKGVDLHSYQPSIEDIKKISTCDLFIYVGGESDGWVTDALAQATNKNMIVINLLDVLGDSVKAEEVKEGMQAEEHEHEEAEEEEVENDEHVWLSLKNAKVICSKIADSMKKIDAANAGKYDKNLAKYNKELDALDKSYQDTVNSSDKKTLLFADRFPFRYMIEDYKLDYYAAFVGCSSETNASFETVSFLAKKVDELGLSTIFTIEKSDGKIADTVKQNTKSKDQKIVVLDSMQSVTSDDINKGETYLNVMKSNLDILRESLK
ncbi:metal ABC transporter substrate-binding protein [Eubacterium xylanophilum]|uniref:metal ABC transporter substrate-binding protein n=1 Tax=Eubacterium xylanophilum TaxID=39497 RepID=UPI00047C654B|nr:metal ABC transporter substrate-binding protein [Eubacterium xylanophilum]